MSDATVVLAPVCLDATTTTSDTTPDTVDTRASPWWRVRRVADEPHADAGRGNH